VFLCALPKGGSVRWNKKTGQGNYIMSIFKSASALFAGAVMSIGDFGNRASVATAADLLPLKAKKPVVGAYVPLDVHGYFRPHLRHDARHRLAA